MGLLVMLLLFFWREDLHDCEVSNRAEDLKLRKY